MADSTTLVSGVAERYATALFELALDAGALDAAKDDLQRVEELIEMSPDLQRLVKSPTFSASEQLAAIGAVLERAGIGGLVANFIKVVARNRRLFAAPDMIKAVRQKLARHRGEVSALVTSAEPLGELHLAALREALRSRLGKDVILERKVDPSLIGGLIVQVGSRMVDTSLRTKLNAMKFAMKEVG